MKLIPSIAFLAATLGLALGTEETKRFQLGLGITWPSFSYPSSFQLDPESFGGEGKWCAELRDPTSGISIKISAYGYVSQFDLLTEEDASNFNTKAAEEGFDYDKFFSEKARYKNAAAYFKGEVLPDGCEITSQSGVERFIHRASSCVTVYFLSPEAAKASYGRCFESIAIHFPEGTFPKHQVVIDAIIESVRSSFEPMPAEESEDQEVDSK